MQKLEQEKERQRTRIRNAETAREQPKAKIAAEYQEKNKAVVSMACWHWLTDRENSQTSNVRPNVISSKLNKSIKTGTGSCVRYSRRSKRIPSSTVDRPDVS